MIVHGIMLALYFFRNVRFQPFKENLLAYASYSLFKLLSFNISELSLTELET